MRRYRFPSQAVPFRRIAGAIVCCTVVLDVLLALVLTWLVMRGGAL